MATYEENIQWMQTLSPEKREIIQNIANLGVMRSNARNTSSRLGQQRSEISFKQAGGEAAYQNLISQLKTDPQLYQEWKNRAQRTGGLGQGTTELAMLAAFGALPTTGLASAQTASTIPGQVASSIGAAGVPAGAAISTGEMLSANEIASLAGNPAAFSAYQSAGMIPAGMSMSPAGAVLTSAGTPLVSAGGAWTGMLGTIGNVASGGGNVLSNLASPNTLGSLVSGAGALYGSKTAADSASQAAAIQAQATQAALDEQKRQFDIGQQAQMPWRTAGQTALTSQMNLMGLGPQGAEGQLSELTSSPGYTFRLGEGQKALERSAAARGGLFSGGAGKALTRYGQDYATGEYGNRLSQLSSLSGTGQAAASGMAGQGTTYAGNVSNLLTGGANAQAAGALAQGQAKQAGILGVGQSLSNIFNPPKQQPTLADLLRGGNYGY